MDSKNSQSLFNKLQFEMIRNGFTFILLAVALLVCDGSALEIEPRSSNGTLSARDEFPFFASIDIKNEDGTTAICGASLLNDQWLVTTANCLKGADEVAVHLGSEEEGRIRINVPKGNWFENPQYNEERFVNDIGLIKLPEPIQFTSDIQPIELSPVDETIRSNTEVILIGSGASKTVESTVLSVTSMAECKNTFVSLRGACSSFCAKDTTNGEKSICAGDAGEHTFKSFISS